MLRCLSLRTSTWLAAFFVASSTFDRAEALAARLASRAVYLHKDQTTWRELGSRRQLGAKAAVRASHASEPVAQRTSSTRIHPGFTEESLHWFDTAGKRIEAHGAGMLQSPTDGRWYWYGESKKGDLVNPGVNCYSASTLAGPWTNEGRVLSSTDVEGLGWSPPYVLERPKVIYNARTKKFVMWVHVDHVRGDPQGALMRRTDVTEDQCDAYFHEEGCAWTSHWHCPFQKPGERGPAVDDGSLGFQCCCQQQLWKKASDAECGEYLSTSGCAWTSQYSCPGQDAGDKGLAADDESLDWQCCCAERLWQDDTAAALIERLLGNSSRHDRQLNMLGLGVGKAREKARTQRKMRRQHVIKQRLRLQRRKHQFDEYVLRRVGVAVSDHAAGPFELVHMLKPDGISSLDLSLWVDNDGTAYFIRSCDNDYTGISRLTDDYLNTSGLLSQGPRFEGMSLFRHTNGTLYMMTSHLTGWAPNPLMLFRSDGPNLSQPQWVNVGNPTNAPLSFNTQPTFVVPYTTKSGLTYNIYMADNWVHGGRLGLYDATYVWLPIRFAEDGCVHLDRLLEWDLENPFDEENLARSKAAEQKRTLSALAVKRPRRRAA
mmetsp:Transcript_2114/g.5193  ORF Transcript_2114/g.5193 Transcript_2114/m.5193 type:complete len:600 (+) Transcript_2114:97-1896(+)